RDPRAVDFAGTDPDAVSGRGAVLARTRPALPRRRADEALRRARGDWRTCPVHVLRRLPVHDCGYGLCERRRRMEMSELPFSTGEPYQLTKRFLPLKGGGRRPKVAGWGSFRNAGGPKLTPPRRVLRADPPLSAEGKVNSP